MFGLSQFAAVSVILILAGCVSIPSHERATEGAYIPRVTVALVDSGINPYHHAFRAPGFELPAELAVLAKPVTLTFGENWTADYEADKEFWANLDHGQLYWFRETRILGISLADPQLNPPYLLDTIGHGTLTSNAVLELDPTAIIVMVEAGSTPQALPPFVDLRYIVDPIRWTTDQPWIDVISLSLGFPAQVPLKGLEAVPHLLAKAVSEGKIVVGGTGNDLTPSMSDQISGPPWVVKAGGVVTAQRGEAAAASKAPDFVQGFQVDLACPRSVTATCQDSGTSFSTPRVAGTFARAIEVLRTQTNQTYGIRDGLLVDSAQFRLAGLKLRNAFNQSAVYWNASDFSPEAPPPSTNLGALFGYFATPIGPTPWTQMGWGYLPPGVADAVAAALLHNQTLPEKPPAAVAYMEALDRARWEYWNRQGNASS